MPCILSLQLVHSYLVLVIDNLPQFHQVLLLEYQVIDCSVEHFRVFSEEDLLMLTIRLILLQVGVALIDV